MNGKEISVDFYTGFEEAKGPWETITAKGHLYVFQTYEWLFNYYEHVGSRSNVKPLFISITLDSGEPLYFFPLVISRKKGFRVLQWMGGILVDYGAPVVSELAYELAGRNELDFPSIWSRVIKSLQDVDVVWLSRLPETIADRPNPMLELPCKPYRTKAYYSRTTCDWDSFYKAKAGAKTRSTDGRKERRLAEEGRIDFVSGDGSDDEDFDRIARAMIDQKQERYRSIRASNLLAREGYRDFFMNPTECLRSSGLLHLSALVQGDAVLAAHWGMIYRKRFYYFMPSFAHGRLAKYSPGRLLLIKLLQLCMQQGIEVFDFTIGEEPYKKDWYDCEASLYEYFEPLSKRGGFLSIPYAFYSYVAARSGLLDVARRTRRIFYLAR